MNDLIGNCGRKVRTSCFPPIEDDFCPSCPFNGWEEQREDQENEEENDDPW